MEFLKQALDIFLHLDVHLNDLATTLGPWLYVLLFAIIFAETGLVVTPFLPGDSLLFAVGALAAMEGSPLHPGNIAALLVIAAVLGDAVNYAIGARIGPKVFTSETSRLLNKEHLMRTERFYEKYGGKTIIIARFMPILRTFVPVVAGVAQMTYRAFASFNVIGAAAWVLSMTLLGYFLGSFAERSGFPLEKHIEKVIIIVVFLSVLPGLIEYLRHRARSKAEGGDARP
jgi:membrane-associated protein